MKTLSLSCMLLLAAGAPAHAAPETKEIETVVLLHGLALRSWAMERVAHALRADGFRVVNLTYPSRTMPIERLAHEWLPAQLRAAQLPETARVHFVTHSMGGIIVRLLQRYFPEAWHGRVVMIAPPNHGSEIVDHLDRFSFFRWFTGENGRRLGTNASSVVAGLGAWRPEAGELGIIAGDASSNSLFTSWLGGPNDGRVAVASTRLAGMTDFVLLHHSHTWLQWRGDTVVQVRAFLRDGRFIHAAPAAAE
jgi:triacylglycerol lipase